MLQPFVVQRLHFFQAKEISVNNEFEKKLRSCCFTARDLQGANGLPTEKMEEDSEADVDLELAEMTKTLWCDISVLLQNKIPSGLVKYSSCIPVRSTQLVGWFLKRRCPWDWDGQNRCREVPRPKENHLIIPQTGRTA